MGQVRGLIVAGLRSSSNTRTQELPTQDQTPEISTFGTSLPKPEFLGSCYIALCIRQSLEVVLSFAAICRTADKCRDAQTTDVGLWVGETMEALSAHIPYSGCRKQGFLGNYADIKSPCIYLVYIPLSGALSAALCSACPYRIIDLLRRSGLERAEHNQRLS